MSNAATDRRPRVAYRLPDGSIARIILDHGTVIQPHVSFAMHGGRVTLIRIVDESLVGTVAVAS